MVNEGWGKRKVKGFKSSCGDRRCRVENGYLCDLLTNPELSKPTAPAPVAGSVPPSSSFSSSNSSSTSTSTFTSTFTFMNVEEIETIFQFKC
jgi:hypothetical protein